MPLIKLKSESKTLSVASCRREMYPVGSRIPEQILRDLCIRTQFSEQVRAAQRGQRYLGFDVKLGGGLVVGVLIWGVRLTRLSICLKGLCWLMRTWFGIENIALITVLWGYSCYDVLI